jgi:hypothetical protein
MNRPYVVKLGAWWRWGCWDCGHRPHGYRWHDAVALALLHNMSCHWNR